MLKTVYYIFANPNLNMIDNSSVAPYKNDREGFNKRAREEAQEYILEQT